MGKGTPGICRVPVIVYFLTQVLLIWVLSLFFFMSVLLITIHYTLHCYMNYQLFCDFSISRLYFSIKNEKKKKKKYKLKKEMGEPASWIWDK